MRRFWPVGEAAQADYEALRAAELAGTPLASPAALRFARAGMGALIARPSSEPVFAGALVGAERRPWTPHEDPRLGVLRACYGLLLEVWGDHVEKPEQETAR